MRRIVDNDFLTLFSRMAIGGMYIAASFYKIIEPATFAKSIWQYHMVPGELINIMAIVLPWLELVVGLALIFGLFYRGAVWWSIGLLVMFIVALSYTIAQGIDISCGCFKAGGSATGPAWQSLWLDVGAIVLALQLVFSRSCRWSCGRARSVE